MTHCMRIRFLLAALGMTGLVASAAGCAHPARQRLVGEWQVSFELTQADMQQVTLTENPLVATLGQALLQSLRADMRWTFRDDGTMSAGVTALGQSLSRGGRWTFVRGTPDSVTISAEFEGDEPRELTFRFLDDDTFEAAPYAGGGWQLDRLVNFRRVTGASPAS